VRCPVLDGRPLTQRFPKGANHACARHSVAGRHAQLGRHSGGPMSTRRSPSTGPVSAGPSWTPARSSATTRCAGLAIRTPPHRPEEDPEQTTAWLLYLASDDADGTAKLITDNGGGLIWARRTWRDRPDGRGDDSTGVCSALAGQGRGRYRGVQRAGLAGLEDCRLTDPDAARRSTTSVFGYGYEGVPALRTTTRVHVNGEVAAGSAA